MQTEEVSMKVAMTMQDACQAWGIHPTLVKNLEDDGIKEFFEIQTKAIPQILDCPSQRYSDYSQATDVTSLVTSRSAHPPAVERPLYVISPLPPF